MSEVFFGPPGMVAVKRGGGGGSKTLTGKGR